ncbi:MAG: hypothetical protein A2527_13855 [Candidatus Lambdaproteobacteria bacterium RIFOXYD2_FULL_50_16]|uniref:SbsA Ig-like domain-containing protein n=1 Tax=Candidatus Lambdaproteobacteria bacterium RIFOXYD2_FULL_50_16 TaxID=1817772 RepID=A0A1F6G4H2_9PROT|nr:MAG: hypothetical protein A2527_13855 [Candidatus Lambdaproteobacteria bacterium RIFOXYD2_FULL_50_16]
MKAKFWIILGLGLWLAGCEPKDNGNQEAPVATVHLATPWNVPLGAQTALEGQGSQLVLAVPAAKNSVNNLEEITDFVDRAWADELANEVVLNLPLGEPLRLIKAIYEQPITATDLKGLRPKRIGLSGIFSVDAATDQLTLPITLYQPPQLASLLPKDGATGVLFDTSIAITFTGPLDATTLTVNAKDSQCSGNLQLSSDGFTSCVVLSSTLSLSNGGNTVTMTPAQALSAKTKYQVRLTDGLRDLLGNGPPKAYTSAGFTTADPATATVLKDTTAPKATGLTPTSGATGISITSPLVGTFSEAMDPTSLKVNTLNTTCTGAVQVSLDNFKNCLRFSAQPTHSPDQTQFTFILAAPLAYETTYRIKLTQSATDLAGNKLDQQYITTGFTTVIPGAPTIASASPTDGTIGVSPNGVVSVTFSEAMDPASLTGTSSSACTGSILLSANDFRSCAILSSFTVSNSNRTFSFSAEMNDGQTYKLRVTTEATSALGKTLASTQTYSTGFTVYAGLASFYSNASNWMDFYKNDDATTTPPNPYKGSNAACVGTESTWQACLHGGERKVVTLPSNIASCTGVTATDALGAFTWECITSPVRIVSKGLAAGKHISDLIDWNAIPLAFKTNYVIIQNNSSTVLQTEPSTWWTNPIAQNSTALNTSGTLYAFTADPATDLVTAADKVAVVAKPGVTLTGSVAAGKVLLANHHFVWVEGTFNAASAGSSYGISQTGKNFSVLRQVTVSGASADGVYLKNSQNTRLEYLTSSGNSTRGIYLLGVAHASLSQVIATGNNNTGLKLESGGARARGLWLTNNSANGLEGFVGDYSQFLDLVTANNGGKGVSWWGDQNRVLVNLISANNASQGISSFQGVYLAYLNVTSANSGGNGIYNDYTYNHSYLNSVALNSSGHGLSTGSYGVYTQWANLASGSSGAKGYNNSWTASSGADAFLGYLIFGGNAADCYAALTQKVAGIDANCLAPDPPSNFVLRQGQAISAAFVGLVGANDTTNGSPQTAGEAPVGSITDWTQFSNPQRTWGKSGGTSIATTHRGRCTIGNCAVWDWSLKSTDSVLFGVHSTPPTGNDYYQHIWKATTKALCNEIPGALWTGSCSDGVSTTSTACGTALGTWSIAGACSHPAIGVQASCTSWGWCSDKSLDASSTCVASCSDTNQALQADCVNTCTEPTLTSQATCGVCSNGVFPDATACGLGGATWTAWTWAGGVCSDPAKNTSAKCGTCSDGVSTTSSTCATALGTWTAQTWAARTWTNRTWTPGDWNTTEKCVSTFLKHAYEIMEDGIGNENGLCESNEACVFTPNIGAYQGHGTLTEISGAFTDGTLTGIKLYQYSNNGR